MIEQLMDSYRKASASWLQLQQDTFKQLANKQRESLDAAYTSGIQVIEQTRKLLDNFKTQSEAQMRDFQTWAEKSMAAVQSPQA
jgi:hypothetical protein